MIVTVLDTGPLAAAFNAAGPAASRVRIAPDVADWTPSAAESGPDRSLLERWPKVEAAFLTEVARGTFELIHLTPADLASMSELILQYADFPLGGVDVSVVAVAERFGVDRVATWTVVTSES